MLLERIPATTQMRLGGGASFVCRHRRGRGGGTRTRQKQWVVHFVCLGSGFQILTRKEGAGRMVLGLPVVLKVSQAWRRRSRSVQKGFVTSFMIYPTAMQHVSSAHWVLARSPPAHCNARPLTRKIKHMQAQCNHSADNQRHLPMSSTLNPCHLPMSSQPTSLLHVIPFRAPLTRTHTNGRGSDRALEQITWRLHSARTMVVDWRD